MPSGNDNIDAAGIAQSLGGRRQGDGYLAHCPAHDDQHVSLSLCDRDDRVLIHCHAGCASEDVIAALQAQHLWPDSQLRGHRTTPAPAESYAYDYLDADGQMRYQVVRKPGKKFIQRRPNGNGGWIYTVRDVTRVLYRLPEIRASIGTVYVAEGEKDTDRLWSVGLPATTNAGGAGKWMDVYSETLRDRDVVILPDNDEPGLQHAKHIAKSLEGRAASVRVLQLPDLRPKGDVSDWLDAGHTASELTRLAESAASGSAWGAEPSSQGVSDRIRHIKKITVANARPREVGWFWHPYLPRGEVSILVGDGGIGKSTLASYLASCASAGRLPFSGERCGPSDVLFLSAEEDPEAGTHVRDRFELMHADTQRIHYLQGEASVADDSDLHTLQLDEGGIELLRQQFAETRARLLIIDPIIEVAAAAGVDTHRSDEVRRMMVPLRQTARDYGATVLALIHVNRASGVTASARVQGSSDWRNFARSALVMAVHPDNSEWRIVAHDKSNLGPKGVSLACSFDSVLGWQWHGVADYSSDQVVNPPSERYWQTDADKAKDWLREHLSARARPAGAVITDAASAGIKEHTLRRAFKELGGKTSRAFAEGAGRDQPWMWSPVGPIDDTVSDPDPGMLSSSQNGVRTPMGIDDTRIPCQVVGNGADPPNPLDDNIPGSDDRVELLHTFGDTPYFSCQPGHDHYFVNTAGQAVCAICHPPAGNFEVLTA